MSLRARLIAIAIVPALVAIVLAGAVAFAIGRRSVSNAAQAELRRSLEDYAEVLPIVTRLNAQAQQRLLQRFLRATEVNAYVIRDGAVVVPAQNPNQFVTGLDLGLLGTGSTISGTGRQAGGRAVIWAARVGDMRRQDGSGTLLVATRDTSSLALVPGGGSRLIFAAGVAVTIAVALALLLARRLATSLKAVSRAAAGVAAGDYGRTIDAGMKGELGELVTGFNDMSAALAAARTREREFIMDVSHDLRTPLTSVRGYAEGIADGTLSPPDAAAIIEREARRLERLVADLLSLARLDAGHAQLEFETVDLVGLTHELVESHRPRFAAAGISVEVVATEVSQTAVTDPDRVAQALGNLLDNALRYAPVATKVTVLLGQAADGAHTAIDVADCGRGIAPADISRVFDRLYVSSHYPGERPEGSGLGLAIVARLMAALGGGVSVASTPGVGSTFRLIIPCTRDGDAGKVAR